MKAYKFQIESLSNIIFTRPVDPTLKEQREKHNEFDKRIWREKAHCDGEAVKIPGVMFKRSLESAAKYLKEKIPGQRMATYSKPFLSAVQIIDDITLAVAKTELKHVDIYCNADGRRGSGTRVMRRFPVVPEWAGELTVYVGDDVITKDVLVRHVKAAGQFIGIGGFRAENGNQGGRFRIKLDAKGSLQVHESEVTI